ncbi:hypothetical protein [Thioalkalivibrio sp. ALE23]|uniref:hypothetical protein n=1 Tax=Thioalkalivibrio sp. ALE23 TaxID=1265495 RepID=UPI0012DD6962|nr:hypothetical protein [Thioalkalivibrio sp. ALE23]
MDANWNNRHERARALLQYVAEAGASEKGDHALRELRRYIDSMEAAEQERASAHRVDPDRGTSSSLISRGDLGVQAEEEAHFSLVNDHEYRS